MMDNKRRNTNIEFLRLFLMFAIFIWHILVHGYNLKNIGIQNVTASDLQLVLMSLTSPATYCFMFISGFYGISYSHKKFFHIIFCLFSAMFISSLIKVILNMPITGLTMFPLTKKIWWFIYYYMIIMVLSPILNAGIEKIPKKHFLIVTSIMLYFLTGSMLQFKMHNGSNLLGLLTVYLVSRYIRTSSITLTKRMAFLSFIISALILIGSVLFLNSYENKYIFIFLSYCNPLIVIMAISLFFIAFTKTCRIRGVAFL